MLKFIFPCVLIFFAILVSAEEAQLPEKFHVFFDWIRDQGAIFPKIELKQMSANMRGIYALEDIKDKERILFVPDSVIVTLEKA